MKFFYHRFVIVISLFLLVSCNTNSKKPFSFVQLADTQLGFEDYERDLQSFEQAVKQINLLGPDFVVICGDLVNVPGDSTYADFKKIEKKLTMPCYCVAGNHDVRNMPCDSSLIYYRKMIGDDYYSFQHKGCSFIVTNTQLWDANVAFESEAHNDWIKKSLEEASIKEDRVFVIGHAPLFTADSEESKNYFNFSVEKRKEVLQLFKENRVVAYLSGHTHKLIINNYKGIQLVSSETTSKNFDNRPLGFRLWDVSPDSIKHRFVPLD